MGKFMVLGPIDPHELNERNKLTVAEFRANAGKLSNEVLRNDDMLLLTIKGRKSGRLYITPMRYILDGDRYILNGMHRAQEEDADWCKNLAAAGEATVEVGTETFEAVSEVLEDDDEREELHRAWNERYPLFEMYENITTRRIPWFALTRR